LSSKISINISQLSTYARGSDLKPAPPAQAEWFVSIRKTFREDQEGNSRHAFHKNVFRYQRKANEWVNEVTI
jgi:hypothetical protein